MRRRGRPWAHPLSICFSLPRRIAGEFRCPMSLVPLDELTSFLRRFEADVDPPYVCPGCHAVAPDRCVPGCVDDETEAERRHAIESGDYDETGEANQ